MIKCLDITRSWSIFAFCWRWTGPCAVRNIRWCVSPTKSGIRSRFALVLWSGSTCRTWAFGRLHVSFAGRDAVFRLVGVRGSGPVRRVRSHCCKIRTVVDQMPSTCWMTVCPHGAPSWKDVYENRENQLKNSNRSITLSPKGDKFSPSQLFMLFVSFSIRFGGLMPLLINALEIIKWNTIFILQFHNKFIIIRR